MAGWFTEADFAMNLCMKCHMGGILTMGKGEIQKNSMNCNINTKQYTESELVLANYVLSNLLCIKNFLKQQGYDFDPTLHQDNTSRILLERNGMKISSKRT